MQPLPLEAPHFITAVRNQLVTTYGEEKVLTGGLQIHTTLDLPLQQFAQKVVASEVNKLASQQVSNGAAVVLAPQTGEILSMVGSKDYYNEKIDGAYNVILAQRQPGSTFKPFLYAMALESNYTAATILLDTKTTFYQSEDNVYEPVNYDSQFHGPVTIRQALGNSYNIPATRMLAVLSLHNFVNYLHKLGFTDIESQNTGLSLALGGHEVKPLDLASAFASFANQGYQPTPTGIKTIKDNEENTIFTANTSTKKQTIRPEVAYIISDILSDNQARTQSFGTNSLLNIASHKVAVKTGTSNKKRDNWAVGYTPQFVVLSWVGNNDHSPMGNVTSGVTGATPIWRQITEQLFTHTNPSWYEMPSSIVTANIEQSSGKKYCGQGKESKELFVSGSQPEECAQLETVLVEEREGQAVIVEALSQDQQDKFQQDPQQFIQDNKDKLQADEKPTPIYTQAQMTVSDPLSRRAQSTNNKIYLSRLY